MRAESKANAIHWSGLGVSHGVRSPARQTVAAQLMLCQLCARRYSTPLHTEKAFLVQKKRKRLALNCQVLCSDNNFSCTGCKGSYALQSTGLPIAGNYQFHIPCALGPPSSRLTPRHATPRHAARGQQVERSASPRTASHRLARHLASVVKDVL